MSTEPKPDGRSTAVSDALSREAIEHARLAEELYGKPARRVIFINLKNLKGKVKGEAGDGVRDVMFPTDDPIVRVAE